MSSRSSAHSNQSATADANRAVLPAPPNQPTLVSLWASVWTRETQTWLAGTLVALFVAIFIWKVGSHTLVRYWAYRADAFDLGNMDQAVWNTLHGHPFRFTNVGLDWYGPPTRLGIHVEPILLLIAPLYLLHSGPETLILLQTVALGLGAIPLFLLSLRRLPELPLLGAAFTGAYLLAPELLGEALWDFHAVALATPLLLLALWALDSRRYAWFVVAAILAALTKEDVALALIPLGLYLAIWHRKPRLGFTVAALSVVWVAICFGVILPHFHGSSAGGNNYWYRYDWAGSTPGSAVVNVLTHPWLPVTFVLSDTARRGYLAMLLRTAGGLGVLSPALWICGLPELAVNLLSTHEEQYSGFFQYNAILLVFLTGASVYGAEVLYRARLARQTCSHETSVETAPESGQADDASDTSRAPFARLAQWLRMASARIGYWWRAALSRLPIPAQAIAPALILWLVVASVWNLRTASPRFDAFWRAGNTSTQNQAQIDALLARVPTSASVAATDSLDPHLSDRYTLYLMPDPRSYTAQYVAVDIPAAISLSQAADEQMYAAMLASGHYTIVGTVYSGGDQITLLHRVGKPLVPAARVP